MSVVCSSGVRGQPSVLHMSKVSPLFFLVSKVSSLFFRFQRSALCSSYVKVQPSVLQMSKVNPLFFMFQRSALCSSYVKGQPSVLDMSKVSPLFFISQRSALCICSSYSKGNFSALQVSKVSPLFFRSQRSVFCYPGLQGQLCGILYQKSVIYWFTLVTSKCVTQCLPCRASGFAGSVLGLFGPVSVCRKFGLQLLFQCDSTYNCASRSSPERHWQCVGTLSNQEATTTCVCLVSRIGLQSPGCLTSVLCS